MREDSYVRRGDASFIEKLYLMQDIISASLALYPSRPSLSQRSSNFSNFAVYELTVVGSQPRTHHEFQASLFERDVILHLRYGLNLRLLLLTLAEISHQGEKLRLVVVDYLRDRSRLDGSPWSCALLAHKLETDYYRIQNRRNYYILREAIVSSLVHVVVNRSTRTQAAQRGVSL